MKVVVGETIDAWVLWLVAVQVVTLFFVIAQNGKIRRLERALFAKRSQRRSKAGFSSDSEEEAAGPSEFERQKAGVKEQKEEFKRFLEADPARKLLAKKEQFAAYRQWRAEQGLTWTGNSTD